MMHELNPYVLWKFSQYQFAPYILYWSDLIEILITHIQKKNAISKEFWNKMKWIK